MSKTVIEIPTERELNLACAIVIRKTIRLFFDVPESEPPRGSEIRLLENWRQVPRERREAALLEFQRQLWRGLLDRLAGCGPQPGELPYEYLIKKGVKWSK